MAAENQDIECWQGDSFQRVFTVYENGSIKTLGGASAAWGISRSPGGTLVLDDSDADVTAEVTDAQAGEVTVTADQAATEDLSGDYFHELEVTDTDGQSSTVATGVLTVNADIVD